MMLLDYLGRKNITVKAPNKIFCECYDFFFLNKKDKIYQKMEKMFHLFSILLI